MSSQLWSPWIGLILMVLLTSAAAPAAALGGPVYFVCAVLEGDDVFIGNLPTATQGPAQDVYDATLGPAGAATCDAAHAVTDLLPGL
jgi:hypothetical protein